MNRRNAYGGDCLNPEAKVFHHEAAVAMHLPVAPELDGMTLLAAIGPEP